MRGAGPRGNAWERGRRVWQAAAAAIFGVGTAAAWFELPPAFTKRGVDVRTAAVTVTRRRGELQG